jgi:hypothetical protein
MIEKITNISIGKEAIKFDGKNQEEIKSWLGVNFGFTKDKLQNHILTSEDGHIIVSENDYIIKKNNGSIYFSKSIE